MVASINAFCNEHNAIFADKCSEIINDFQLANNDFYRAAEEFLDSLLETHAQQKDFLLLTSQAEILVDKLGDLMFNQGIYTDFIVTFSTILRTQSEITRNFSSNKLLLNKPIFENICKSLANKGFIDNKENKVTSPELENIRMHVNYIMQTRKINLTMCLDLYNQIVRYDLLRTKSKIKKTYK